MKKVINGNELREKMKEAIDLLCGTVKTTLGPKGNNVIIDHSTFSPFITNDGVTIAENIESEDPIINTILELAKEASIKTNDTVGDGTTTTLVLLESIFNKGLEIIDNGINPLILKRELDLALKNVVSMIEEKARKTKLRELQMIASVSANDEAIGNLISDVYNKVKIKEAINISEGDSEETKVEYIEGYSFDTMLASSYFLKNSDIIYNKPYVLLINDYLESIEQIANVLNFIIKENKTLIIIAKDYSDILINEVVSLYLENDIKIVLFKFPLYGTKQISFCEDINTIIEDKVVNTSNLVQINNLHPIKNIRINKDKTTIGFNSNSYTKKHLKLLKKILNNNEIEKDYLQKRIAMFENGTAEIIVGAPTKLERREKKMRFDDALCAIDSCKLGVLPGSGLTLLEISERLDISNCGNKILKESLIKPLEQIIINGALELSIIDKIKDNNYKVIYNLNIDDFENIDSTRILDSALVVINSLKNACSIASMLLTTSSLVINEYKNNLNKINEYNEL